MDVAHDKACALLVGIRLWWRERNSRRGFSGEEIAAVQGWRGLSAWISPLRSRGQVLGVSGFSWESVVYARREPHPPWMLHTTKRVRSWLSVVCGGGKDIPAER